MKGDPEQRALLLGEYIVEHGATVRAAARAFGCSKSTVHKDVSVRLRTVGPELFRQVQMVLARNKAERHLRGGAALVVAALAAEGHTEITCLTHLDRGYEELEDCRRGLLSGMNGVEDSLGGMETWYYIEVLRAGANSAAPIQTPAQARAALQAVTKEDVRSILRQLTLSVSYLLTKEEPTHA